MEALSVRKALAQDVPRIEAIVAAAYAPYTSRIGRPAAPVTADYARAVSRREVWVAEADGVVTGLVVLVARPDHLLLENVAVDPAAHGTGIGMRLLAEAEEQALRLGLPEIRLYTNVAMTENLTYYPRRGYVETHRGHEDGFDRVHFSKRIGPGSR
jgi:N-acetylglutamate synthase-like GNAT family acetyltransferase